MSIEGKLHSLGMELSPLPAPAGNYAHFVKSGSHLYRAGKGPIDTRGAKFTGRVGEDVTVEEAYRHARSVGLMQIAVMRSALGILDRVTRIVKVLGMVNATPYFTQHPQVNNGFSDLMVEVFGPVGVHARSAVGMNSLPGGITVEDEAIVEFMTRDEDPGVSA